MYVVFNSMDVKIFRFSTNQKRKDEFSRERAMGERWKCILCRKYFLIAIRKTNNWRSVSQELAVKQLSVGTERQLRKWGDRGCDERACRPLELDINDKPVPRLQPSAAPIMLLEYTCAVR